MTVCVTRAAAPVGCPPVRPPPPVRAARGDERVERVAIELGLEPRDLRLGLGLEVVAAGALDLAPLLDVAVELLEVGLDRGPVDRHLEPRVEHDLVALPAVLRDDLGGDVAPIDHGQGRGHQAAPAANAMTRHGEVAEADLAMLERQAETACSGLRQREDGRVLGLPEVHDPAIVAEVGRLQLGVAVEAEPPPDQPLEVAGQEVGQVERARLLVGEGRERAGARVELIAVGTGRRSIPSSASR